MNDDDSHSPTEFLTAFLLEKIEQEPIERQIRLYRSVAITTGDKDLARDCRTHAAALSDSVKRARQLRLNFHHRTGGSR